MEGKKKARLEAVLIVVLLGVFALVLVVTLKRVGLLPARTEGATSSVPSTPTASRAASSAPAPSEPRGTTATATPTAPASAPPDVSARSTPIATTQENVASPPKYTAQNLRDPFQSLLPLPPRFPNAVVPLGAGSGGMTNPSPLPPTAAGGLPSPLVAPSVLLQGMVWGGPNPAAIINNEVYGIGSLVGGGTITAITSEGVTLNFGGRPIQVLIASVGKDRPAAPSPRPIRR